MYEKHDVVRGLAVAVAVTTLAGLLLATTASAATPTRSPVTPVSWAACPEDVEDAFEQLQCAQIPVPLDYTDPEGESITIMISRLASRDTSKRRGVLMLNPGGPGESGLSQSLSMVKQGLPVNVSSAYDLIGMDTRGIGHSAPISCGFTVEQNFTGAVPPYAADGAAVAEQAGVAQGVAAQCAANDVNGYLRHTTTANTARDLDQIRIALGETKISYYGVSYGTALGAAYASMFPDRTDRMVMDSAIGDTHLDQDGMRRYGLGAEQTLPDFERWAAARDGTYGLGSTPAQVRATYFELAARLDKNPIPGVDGHVFRLFTYISLFGESLYAGTAQLWQEILLSDEASVAVQVDPSGSAATPPARSAGTIAAKDNSFAVFQAVTCNDSKFSGDVEVYQRAVAQDRVKYPVFGAATANITPCAFWAHEPAEPPVQIVDDGPQNILIVQHRHDPTTPYIGGVMLRNKFQQRSQLVSVDGSGHGVYVYGDSACADNITTAFLVNGTMPATDRRC